MAVEAVDPPAVCVGSRVPAGDTEGAAEDAPVPLAAALVGVPSALALAGSLGRAARVVEAVKHAAALPRGGALAVPGAAEGLAGAVGVAPPLGAGALLADEEALARAETEVDALLEGGSEAEGQGVPLLLPLGDPEGRALRDGDSEARGEEESRGVPVCCAAVPLCVRDAAELPVAAALRMGEGEGQPLPVAASADAVWPPLTLGEREPD